MPKNNEIKEIKLNIYDDDENIIKTVNAHLAKIRMGSIRSLMRVVKIEEAETTKDVLATVSKAWDKIEKIIDKMFPDLTEEDWDGVDALELAFVVYKVIRFGAGKLDQIPLEDDEKN